MLINNEFLFYFKILMCICWEKSILLTNFKSNVASCLFSSIHWTREGITSIYINSQWNSSSILCQMYWTLRIEHTTKNNSSKQLPDFLKDNNVPSKITCYYVFNKLLPNKWFILECSVSENDSFMIVTYIWQAWNIKQLRKCMNFNLLWYNARNNCKHLKIV